MIDVMKKNDLSNVSADSYEDTWFKAIYPEFTHGVSDEQIDVVETRSSRPNKDGYFPLNTMTGPLEAEMEADAAEFSIHSGET